MPDKTKSKNSDEKLLEEARHRYEIASEAFSEIHRDALDDLEFAYGEQWPSAELNQRNLDKRPSLTINKMPQFINQVTNDQRQNRPSVKVYPVDDAADIETAKILQGLIRHIEYNSSADTAYDVAFDGAVTHGFGYFRAVTDYVSPQSFEQEILIKSIKNPFSVRIDPASVEPDGSDMNWAFIEQDFLKDDFIAKYPDAELSNFSDWSKIGQEYKSDWIGEEKCRVAEYIYKEFETKTLCRLATGEILFKDEINPELLSTLQIVDERTTRVAMIKWFKTNGHEILERGEDTGSYVPLFPVYGKDVNIQGKRVLEGLIRHSKDSQRMYNYFVSAETEAIALAPKAPFIAAEGQITETNKSNWQSANIRSHAFLEYKPISLAGQVMPAPQRQAFEPAVQAISNARMLASEDIKATTGIYDSSLGARSNETSGIAIQRRAVQAQTSNFHFIDNLSRTIRHLGRVLVEKIPLIYDTPRAARIIGEDGEQKIVLLNQIFEENGQQKQFNLSAGKYDVTVDTGPSFQTKRQEALASMGELTRAYPQFAQFAGDLMVKSMDWPGASEIAERLKRTVPPNILGEEQNQQQIPPEVQAQMQQMTQMIDQLTAKINESNDIINNKRAELESKERIEFAKMEVDLKKELFKAQASASSQVMAEELAFIKQRLANLDINQDFDQQFSESGPQEAATYQEPIAPTDGLQTSGQTPIQGEYQ